ncbi:MAG: hypothetical protein M1561_00915 [Gammaproteobacteria bacterium]|nr:hypothetical protein [Gammaproteobacteria bacterium]
MRLSSKFYGQIFNQNGDALTSIVQLGSTGSTYDVYYDVTTALPLNANEMLATVGRGTSTLFFFECVRIDFNLKIIRSFNLAYDNMDVALLPNGYVIAKILNNRSTRRDSVQVSLRDDNDREVKVVILSTMSMPKTGVAITALNNNCLLYAWGDGYKPIPMQAQMFDANLSSIGPIASLGYGFIPNLVRLSDGNTILLSGDTLETSVKYQHSFLETSALTQQVAQKPSGVVIEDVTEEEHEKDVAKIAAKKNQPHKLKDENSNSAHIEAVPKAVKTAAVISERNDNHLKSINIAQTSSASHTTVPWYWYYPVAAVHFVSSACSAAYNSISGYLGAAPVAESPTAQATLSELNLQDIETSRLRAVRNSTFHQPLSFNEWITVTQYLIGMAKKYSLFTWPWNRQHKLSDDEVANLERSQKVLFAYKRNVTAKRSSLVGESDNYVEEFDYLEREIPKLIKLIRIIINTKKNLVESACRNK